MSLAPSMSANKTATLKDAEVAEILQTALKPFSHPAQQATIADMVEQVAEITAEANRMLFKYYEQCATKPPCYGSHYEPIFGSADKTNRLNAWKHVAYTILGEANLAYPSDERERHAWLYATEQYAQTYADMSDRFGHPRNIRHLRTQHADARTLADRYKARL